MILSTTDITCDTLTDEEVLLLKEAVPFLQEKNKCKNVAAPVIFEHLKEKLNKDLTAVTFALALSKLLWETDRLPTLFPHRGRTGGIGNINAQDQIDKDNKNKGSQSTPKKVSLPIAKIEMPIAVKEEVTNVVDDTVDVIPVIDPPLVVEQSVDVVVPNDPETIDEVVTAKEVEPEEPIDTKEETINEEKVDLVKLKKAAEEIKEVSVKPEVKIAEVKEITQMVKKPVEFMKQTSRVKGAWNAVNAKEFLSAIADLCNAKERVFLVSRISEACETEDLTRAVIRTACGFDPGLKTNSVLNWKMCFDIVEEVKVA